MTFNLPDDSRERLSALLPNAQDAVLDALYAQCASDLLSICGIDAVPEGAEIVIEQMILFRYSQIGADGLASQSFSGTSESYLTDYPARLKNAMYRFRRIGLR